MKDSELELNRISGHLSAEPSGFQQQMVFNPSLFQSLWVVTRVRPSRGLKPIFQEEALVDDEPITRHRFQGRSLQRQLAALRWSERHHAEPTKGDEPC